MKNIILFLFIFFQSVFFVSANWYGNHAESFTATSGGRTCSTDGDNAGGANATYGHSAVADNNSSTSLIPETTPYSRPTSGSMRCLYWDAALPTISVAITGGTTLNDTWTNSDVTTTATCSDTGGSGCGIIQRRILTTNTACNTGTTGWSNGSTYNHTTPAGTVRVEYVCYRVRDIALNGYVYTPVRIIKIDKQDPTISVAITGGTTSNDTWTNSDVTTTATCADGSGSGCGTIQRRVSTTAFTNCASGGTWTNNSNRIHTVPSGGVIVEYVCYRVRDNVTNGYVYTPVRIIKIDKEVPIVADISNPSLSARNMLATDSQIITVTVGDSGGSPIELVQGYYTQVSSASLTRYNSNSDNNPSNSASLQVDWDMSLVDNDGSNNDGEKLYRFRVTYVRDEAGNELGTLNSNTNIGYSYQNYPTFANTLSGNIQLSVNSENLSNVSNTANGSVKNIQVRVTDIYGNKIIPVTSIGRNIDFHVQSNNYLRLNQYLNTGTDSALFIGNTTTEIPVGTNTTGEVTGLSSTSGNYTIPLYIFAPTQNADSLVPGQATVTGIEVDINRSTSIEPSDNPQGVNFPIGSISVWADSLYTSNFTGDIVNLGFVDGATQNSNVSIVGAGASGRNLFLEFGGEASIDMSDIALYATGADLTAGALITENQDYASRFKNNTGYAPSSNSIQTLLEVNGTAPNMGDLYLASIVQYTLSGKSIAYPSGIVNKPSYHDTIFTGIDNQLGIEIIGNTSGQNTQEVTSNQFTDDVRILGKIDKTSLRRDIARKVYSVIRNINSKTGTDFTITPTDLNRPLWNVAKFDTLGISRGESLYSEKVLYYGSMSGATVNIQGGTNIEGNKTIVVSSGNVYISGDIYDNDNNATLGIIVLGGNIYIDPAVTEINAILYTDRAVLSSSNGSTALPANTAASTLANQLYIKGSVFSENTLGGSRNLDGSGNSAPLCPYYIPAGDCDSSQEAQIYDLNYVRRYFLDTSNNPAYGGSRSIGLGGAGNSSDGFPVVIEYNPRIQQTPPPFFE